MKFRSPTVASILWYALTYWSIYLSPLGRKQFQNCLDAPEVKSSFLAPAVHRPKKGNVIFFRRTGVGVPEWLTEHLENGLPSVGNIFGTLVKIGLPFEITGNESMNQHFAGILLDIFFPFSQELHNLQASKTPFVPPVGEAEWDYYYSYLFTIHADAESRSKAHPDFTYTDLGSGDAQLYCVYHKPWPTEHLGRITPVFAGPAADSAPESALTDRLRDGPRLDNRRWSELSAYYKIWKEGPRSDIVGFCHYRRLFNFGAVGSSNRATVLSIKDLESNTDSYFDVQVLDQVRGNIVMVARPVKLNMTIWEQYALAHNIKDYCHVLNIISRRYPELMPFAVEHFNSNSLYANNMLVTCWPIFDELCTFLFHLLKDFEKIVPYDRASTYQNRDISFLAERVFDLWLRYKQSTGTKIIECPIFLIQ